jgi:hypothetical protein
MQTHKPLWRQLALATLCSTPLAPAVADTASERIDALERNLAASARLIEKLSARLSELERPAAAARPAAPAATASAAPANSPATASTEQAQAIAALQDSISQISAGLNQRGGDSGVPLHGFADVGAAWSKGDDAVPLRGFNGGTLDIYLTPQFGQRTKGLVELAVEYGEDGTAAIDLERLQIGYTVSDGLTLWAGRFHTPFGLWNTAFHHGANLQTSVTRPRFIDFEDKGGIVPAHSVGAWASGKAALAGGKLTYDGYIANGPSIGGRTLNYRAYTDDSANKMLGFNLGYQPGGSWSGLTVGLHGFGMDVRSRDSSDAETSATRVRMAGAYFGYDEDDWEAIGEFYQFRNADIAGGTSRSSRAGFVQLGRTLGNLTPFVRLEQVTLNGADKYFLSQSAGRSYRRQVVGLRWALDAKSSLKVELGSTREDAAVLLDESGAAAPFTARSYQRGAMQYSVAF